MSFLIRCEEMEQEVEESFTKMIRALMRRKEEIQLEIQSIKTVYLQMKQRMDKQTEQYRRHIPQDDLPLDNEVKFTLEKLSKDIQQKLDQLSLREASFDEIELKFCLEEEYLMNLIVTLGCILIENVQPHSKPEKIVKLKDMPILITKDKSNYYLTALEGTNVFGNTLSLDFVVIFREKLENTGPPNFIGGICMNDDCIFISQKILNVILVYSKKWKYLRKFCKYGYFKDELNGPAGLTWYDSQLYACDAKNNRIQVFKGEKHYAFIGDELGNKVNLTPLRLFNPLFMEVSEHREIVVLHKGNPCFNVYSLQGSLLKTFGSIFSGLIPTGSFFTLMPDNVIVLTSCLQNTIQMYTANRNLSIRVGNSNLKDKNALWNFNFPFGILSLQDDRIILCEMKNNQIYVFSSETISLLSIFS